MSPYRKHSQDVVLIVDPDRVSSVITARILEKMNYVVERVGDATGGLELLQQRRVDLLISEATLPDLPATSFIAMSQRIYAPSTLPVLIVTMDLRPPARLDLLRAGALECLAKPLEAAELRFRVQRALRGVPHPEFGVDSVHLCGDLEAIPLTDVLTVIDLARDTGRIEIASNRDFGFIDTIDGAIRHAEIGTLTGIEALATILRVARGWFRVHRCTSATQQTIEGSTTHAILDATVLGAHRRRTPSVRARGLDELGVSKANLTPPPPELARLARRLAPLVEDPHRLGELELVSRQTEPVEQDVLTITWFGDGREAISTLWEISAPLSPKILHGLRSTDTALRWRFHGRDQDRLVIRIIELDEDSTSWFYLPSDLVILAAPPIGAFVVDPAIRAYVLIHKIPTLIIAPEAEAERLFSPAPFTQISITGARLPELRGETRTLLAAAIRMRVPA